MPLCVHGTCESVTSLALFRVMGAPGASGIAVSTVGVVSYSATFASLAPAIGSLLGGTEVTSLQESCTPLYPSALVTPSENPPAYQPNQTVSCQPHQAAHWSPSLPLVGVAVLQITITGTGLSTAATVTIGGGACTPAPGQSFPGALVCATPAGAAGAQPVLYNGLPTGLTFQFSAAYTPTIASFSPVAFSLAVSQVCLWHSTVEEELLAT